MLIDKILTKKVFLTTGVIFILLIGAGCHYLNTNTPIPTVQPAAKVTPEMLVAPGDTEKEINPKNSPEKITFMLHTSRPFSSDLSVYDAEGNEISRTTSSYQGAQFRLFGVVQYITVPRDSTPNVVISGKMKDYFILDVQGRGDGVNIETRFIDSVVTGTRATISFPAGRVERSTSLFIDKDGDGVTDITLKPVLNGTARVSPP